MQEAPDPRRLLLDGGGIFASVIVAYSAHGEYEFFGFSEPSGDVGGDLVDVVDADGGWVGYVADVSRHGVGAGVVMAMFKSAVRMRLMMAGSLANLLGDVNRVLIPLAAARAHGAQVDDQTVLLIRRR